jgi:hypothetical protein
VQQYFAPNGVVSRPDLLEVEQGVDSSEEGSIEPSATLGDEFRYSIYKLSQYALNSCH